MEIDKDIDMELMDRCLDGVLFHKLTSIYILVLKDEKWTDKED